jgi:hypothetical protein
MRRHGCRPWYWLPLGLICVLLLAACSTADAEPSPTPAVLKTGDCITVTDLGLDSAAPVRKVPCAPAGAVISPNSAFAVYRVVSSTTLEFPVMSREGADNLAGIFCRDPEIEPGTSLYVFPTEASFAMGFRQFLCLDR